MREISSRLYFAMRYTLLPLRARKYAKERGVKLEAWYSTKTGASLRLVKVSKHECMRAHVGFRKSHVHLIRIMGLILIFQGLV